MASPSLSPNSIEGATTTFFHPQDFIPHHIYTNEADASVYDSYSIGRCLGKGGYGAVYSCKHKRTGIERAMKVMAKKQPVALQPPASRVPVVVSDESPPTKHASPEAPLPPNHRRNSNPPKEDNTSRETREFFATKKIDHPNCVTVYECFEDAQSVSMIMDLCHGGDLLYALTSKLGCLSETNAALLVNSILTTIHHCHTQQNVAHLDLKLENIVFTTESYKLKDAKIIDFGLARKIEYEEDVNGGTTCRRVTRVIGSTAYMAPQVFQASYDPRKQDVWSIGIMAFMMIAGYPPFEGASDYQIMAKIMKHKESRMFDADPTTWLTVSDEAKDFIATMMAFDEDKRPTATQALQHPWLQGIREKASLAMDTCFQEDAVYHRAVRSVFRSLANCHKAKSSDLAVWKEATTSLLVSQHGATGAMREVVDDCFRALDSNLDGVLTKENFLLGLQRFYPRAFRDLGTEALDSIWKGLVSSSGDKDVSEQVLTYTEFVSAASSEYLLKDDDRLLFAFSVFSQGVNFITHHSLYHAFHQQNRFDLDFITQMMMCQLDGEMPGGISFPEFRAILRSPKRSFARRVSTESAVNVNSLRWNEPATQEGNAEMSPYYACARSCISWLEKCVLENPENTSLKRELRYDEYVAIDMAAVSSPTKKPRHLWNELVQNDSDSSSHSTEDTYADDTSASFHDIAGEGSEQGQCMGLIVPHLLV